MFETPLTKIFQSRRPPLPKFMFVPCKPDHRAHYRKKIPETDSASGGGVHTPAHVLDPGGGKGQSVPYPKKRARKPIAPRKERVESLSIPPARWHHGGSFSVSCFWLLIVNLRLKQAEARSVVWLEKGTV